MQNILFCYDNHADVADLSWGDYLPDLPLAHVKTRDLHRVARSADAQITSTRMRIALTGPKALKAIQLGPTNLSSGYAYRIRTWTDGAYTVVDHDTGWIGGIPRAPWNTLDWADPNFWLGIIPWEDDERGIWLIHIFASPVTAQYWSIEIDDTGNPDGYVNFGRLFMGRYWQPTISYSFGGNGLRFNDNSLKSSTLNGGERFWRRINQRIFNLGFDYLPEEELYAQGYEFQRIVGYDGEVFVIPEPDDALNLHKRSFLSTATRMDPLTQVVFGYGSTAFELKEVI